MEVDAATKRDLEWHLVLAKRAEAGLQPYTSGRLLEHLLSGQLFHNQPPKICETHELFQVEGQCHKKEDTVFFISCICHKCHLHFNIDCKSPMNRKFHDLHQEDMHLFVVDRRITHDDNTPRLLEKVQTFCIVDGCCCKMNISLLAPVMSKRQIEDLTNVGRVKQHLERARTSDPERFRNDQDNRYIGQEAAATLLAYVKDGLDSEKRDKNLKIKQRNKKFMICFDHDFDDAFRSLGFQEFMLGDTETNGPELCWAFPQLEIPDANVGFTPLNTSRAKWEDLQMQLSLAYPNARNALPGENRKQAWELLEMAFRGQYLPAPNREKWEHISDKDMETIGCLKSYRPAVFAWVVLMLADKDPDNHKKYTEAARRCALERDDEALVALVTLCSRFDSDSPKPETTSNGPMSLQEATNFLGIESNFTAELIQGFVARLAQDPTTDRSKAGDALRAVATWKREEAENKSAEERKRAEEEAAKLEGMSEVFRGDFGSESFPTVSDTAAQNSDTFNTPPGLDNIGNTCYLNSLLQYFYNVKTVRDLVLNYDKFQLDLEPRSVAARRTGGNATIMDLDEAIVARQFMESLHKLFNDLQTTTQQSARPTQKLANTALMSAARLLNQSKPPPLPARPSPAPPKKEQDLINVTVEPVSDNLETASAVSSQTLVNEGEAASDSYVEVTKDGTAEDSVVEESPPKSPDADVTMRGTDEVESKPKTLEDKIQDISARLEQSERRGTAQQDVEEIIGNILEHLMRAVRPQGSIQGLPDLQSDKITQTFFPIIVNHTEKADEPEENAVDEIQADRWIIAYPHPKEGVKSTIYEALDRNFDVEHLTEQSMTRVTSIRTLPPILHICIQRSGQTKNMNPVTIGEILYMDRYMEAKRDSELGRLRRQIWALKSRLEQLQTSLDKGAQYGTKSIQQQNPWGFDATQNWGFTQPLDPSSSEWDVLDNIIGIKSSAAQPSSTTPAITPSTTPPATPSLSINKPAANILANVAREIISSDEEELRSKKMMVDTAFDSMQQQKYRLHAIICHGGGVSAGHYVVWIRDFKKNICIKYNDATVSEDSRECQKLLDELNKTGDPYYLAYVRDELKDELVDVPQRAPREAAAPDEEDIEMQAIEGVAPAESDSEVRPLVTAMEVDDPRPYDIL